MRRPVAAAIVALAVIGLLLAPLRYFLLRQPGVEAWLFRRGFEASLARNVAMLALVQAPALRVLLCGTGSPLPNPARAGPCAAIIAGGHIWLVDAGGGGWRNIMLWHLPADRLAGVLLTHFHSDHIEDLGEVNMQSWIAGRTAPLPVYGGPGVADVVQGFMQAYAHDTDYRIAHHGKQALPPEGAVIEPHDIASASGVALTEGQTAPVLNQDGMKITAIGVNHFPVVPAYGYRFDYGGRSVVISGDTRPSPPLANAAKGADVLVHEAQLNDLLQQAHDITAGHGMARVARMLNDIQTYHTTPSQAAQIANQAGVKLLVLTHLTPPVPAWFAEPAFLRQASAVRPEGTMLGEDGLLITLPPGTSDTQSETLTK